MLINFRHIYRLSIPFSPQIAYNSFTSEKTGSVPYLEDTHLRDWFSYVVGIFTGIVGGLNGLLALVQKCKSYIDGRKAETKKTHQQACRHLMGRGMIAQAIVNHQRAAATSPPLRKYKKIPMSVSLVLGQILL